MKVAVLVGGGVPNPTASGGAVTVWTILNEIVDRGHDARVVVLADAARVGEDAAPQVAHGHVVTALEQPRHDRPLRQRTATRCRIRQRACRDYGELQAETPTPAKSAKMSSSERESSHDG